MAFLSNHDVFRAAMKERRDKHPLVNGGAYKVRESRYNLLHECNAVRSIAEYLRAPRGTYGRSSLLVGCVESDKSARLKRIPKIIAYELGYNLIPAIEALRLEGVPVTGIANFIRSIQPQVDQLLTECDVVQTVTARSIKCEYEAMNAGHSGMVRICAAALSIAEDVVKFCDQHGV